MSIEKDFRIKVLKEKLNFGSELISELNGMISNIDLSKEENIKKVKDRCLSIELFLKEI